MSIPLALVGDLVGAGIIAPVPDPVNALITYRGFPLALTEAPVSVHVGPVHPALPLPAVLFEGSPDCLVANRYRLVRIGDLATCGDPVVMNTGLVSIPIRTAELIERGRPAIP